MDAAHEITGGGHALAAATPFATSSPAAALMRRLEERSLTRHHHFLHLCGDGSPALFRDLTDFVHLLCQVHAARPTLLEQSLERIAGRLRRQVAQAMQAFGGERELVIQLAAATGPVPSTPGAAQSETAIGAARHAISTLVSSERRGCALGTAAAFLVDWRSLRPLLDGVADRMGINPPALLLPGKAELVALLDGAMNDEPDPRRAIAFGAEQLRLQHLVLLDLLQARASARSGI